MVKPWEAGLNLDSFPSEVRCPKRSIIKQLIDDHRIHKNVSVPKEAWAQTVYPGGLALSLVSCDRKVLCKRNSEISALDSEKGTTLTSHHLHSDFKVNNQKSFPLRSLKPESAPETIKAQNRAQIYALHHYHGELLCQSRRKNWMEYSSPLCCENQKCIYLKSRKISEISSNSIMVWDCPGQTMVKRTRKVPAPFRVAAGMLC